MNGNEKVLKKVKKIELEAEEWKLESILEYSRNLKNGVEVDEKKNQNIISKLHQKKAETMAFSIIAQILLNKVDFSKIESSEIDSFTLWQYSL